MTTTIVLAGLAVACFATGKIAEKQGRSADERMGALIPYAFGMLFAAAAALSFVISLFL